METSIPKQFLRSLLGVDDFAPVQIVQWASELRKVTSACALHPLLVELATGNPKTAAGCKAIASALQALADEWLPGFRNQGPLAESIAKEVLFEKCRELLAGKIAPIEFCSLVQHLDARFIDRTLNKNKLTDEVVEYPRWLGNLWNACDWVGENWRPRIDEIPMLGEEVRKLLNDLPPSK